MAKATASLAATRNDLSADTRAKVGEILNQLLADTFDLRSQCKQAHWNVKGANFIALHKLFDELTDSLDEPIDTLAERITALGGVALGTARMAAKASRLPEFPTDGAQDLGFVELLAERFADLGKSMREAIDETDELGDKDAADICTGISRDLDKHLWFLEAHLQDRE
jgi:starvation-inducible DNA-binding protein